MSVFFKRNGEWIYRACLFVAVTANLWIAQNYVAKTEFNQFGHSVSEIEKGMVRMEGVNSVLLDHETRIRVLEKGFTTRDFLKHMSYYDWIDDKSLKYSSINGNKTKDNN